MENGFFKYTKKMLLAASLIYWIQKRLRIFWNFSSYPKPFFYMSL